MSEETTAAETTKKTRKEKDMFSICSGVQIDAKRLNSMVEKTSKSVNKVNAKNGLADMPLLTIYSKKNKTDANGKVEKDAKGNIKKENDELKYRNIDDVAGDDQLRGVIVACLNRALAGKK